MKKFRFITCLYCKNLFKKKRSTNVYCSRSCQMFNLRKTKKIPDRIRKGKTFNCKYCDKEFYVAEFRVKRGDVQYCSRSCLAKIHLSQFSDKRFQPTGNPKHKYKEIKINGKRIREHRHIMQEHLGRKLERWEHVHHINGNSFDNRLENLIVLSNSEHQKVECLERKKIISSCSDQFHAS